MITKKLQIPHTNNKISVGNDLFKWYLIRNDLLSALYLEVQFGAHVVGERVGPEKGDAPLRELLESSVVARAGR